MSVLPKLSYFNIKGLAEPIRLMNLISGVDFTDETFGFEDWPKFKANMPNKQVPVWEKNCVQMAESGAIIRYLGEKYGMAPKGAMEVYNSEVIWGALHITIL